MKQTGEKNLLIRCLTVILVVQFILIAVSNVKMIETNIDCDNAKLFMHIMEMWNQKTIAIPGWSYVTTLELDCAGLLALPLYGMTGNIYLAFVVSNILLLGLFIAVLFYLFRGKNILYPILTANLLCIPYAVGMLDYYNMMFFCGSQYILKVMMPILFAAVLIQMNEQKDGIRCNYVFSALFLVLFFITSMSSGLYVLLVGIMPITIAYFLYKILKNEKLFGKTMVLICISIVIGIVGIYLNRLIMGGARGDSGMVIISVYQVLANVSSCIAGMFELFGGASYASDLPVLSVQGIAVVTKCCVVILFLVCGAIAVYKLVKKKLDLGSILLLAVFFWNLFVLLITNTRAGSATYEYRYHLIGMVPLMCVTSVILADAFENLNGDQKRFFGLAGIFALIILNALSFPVIFKGEDTCADLKELCGYCENLDVDYVYLYDASNDADMCRLIQEDGDPLYLCITPGGSTWVYDYYAEYVDGDIDPKKAMVAIKSEEGELPDILDMFGYQVKKFDTVADRDLYYFVSEGMPKENFAD